VQRRAVGRAASAALLALLTVLAAGVLAPRPSVPLPGAGPASGYVALPEGVTQLAATPRTDPRSVPPAVAPPSPAPAAPVRPLATPAGERSLSPAAVPSRGGRSPPAAPRT
jgi:hypothetical protein